MQDNLIEIYQRLKGMMKKYEESMTATFDLDSRYELWSLKDLVIEGRKRKEVFFAGLIIQRGYVGFYFMPVYADNDIKSLFKPELLKLLKGKSCFHIKKLDEALEKQIEEALETGYQLYKERGWL